jgi:transcriptional regulator NrdR family protein
MDTANLSTATNSPDRSTSPCASARYIPSDMIGGLVMEALASLDQVAYIRFASVYRNFREAKDFGDFVGRIAADGD